MSNSETYIFLLLLGASAEWSRRRKEVKRYQVRQERIQRAMLEMMQGRPVNLDFVFAPDKDDSRDPLYWLAIVALVIIVLFIIYALIASAGHGPSIQPSY